MADSTVVHIGENSAEHVAYQLFREIARSEHRNIMGSSASHEEMADRKWILDTYAACLKIVKDPFGHRS